MNIFVINLDVILMKHSDQKMIQHCDISVKKLLFHLKFSPFTEKIIRHKNTKFYFKISSRAEVLNILQKNIHWTLRVKSNDNF